MNVIVHCFLVTMNVALVVIVLFFVSLFAVHAYTSRYVNDVNANCFTSAKPSFKQ